MKGATKPLPRASDYSSLDNLYLVLGGNGFVGSHIVDSLSAEGKNVRVLDPFRRKPQFKETKNVEILKGDAFDMKVLDKALKGVTHVVYSLSATNPFTADTDPYADVDNLHKGVEILDACVRANVIKIGFISSGGAVYGRLAEEQIAREDDLSLPVSPYGICKLAMEHYLEYFKRKHGLDYIVYRLANPYGPRQAFKNGQGVIMAFLERISQEESITMFGDGSASRDYIYVEDAAKMIASTLAKSNKHAIYNIGSGRLTTLNTIIEALETLLKKKAIVAYAEAPKTVLAKTGLNVSRFREEFGFDDLITFEEGMARTVNHFIDSNPKKVETAV